MKRAPPCFFKQEQKKNKPSSDIQSYSTAWDDSDCSYHTWGQNEYNRVRSKRETVMYMPLSTEGLEKDWQYVHKNRFSDVRRKSVAVGALLTRDRIRCKFGLGRRLSRRSGHVVWIGLMRRLFSSNSFCFYEIRDRKSSSSSLYAAKGKERKGVIAWFSLSNLKSHVTPLP